MIPRALFFVPGTRLKRVFSLYKKIPNLKIFDDDSRSVVNVVSSFCLHYSLGEMD